MNKDKANHYYMEIQNIRITYVPNNDRAKEKDWAGSDVLRIQSRKSDKNHALNMGAELPINGPDDFINMIATLCEVYHTGRASGK